MKKREYLYLLFSILAVVFLTSFASAASNATTANLSGFDKSYACLEDKIGTDYSALTVEELSFSLLALAGNSNQQSKLRDELNARKDSTNDCWPNGACTLRETALAYLALERINANVKDIQNWLLNQTQAPSDLTWYLQVENPSNEQMSCTINIEGNSRSITVRTDKIITGSPGACFTIANNGYFLQVKNTCYDEDIKISCDKDFLTSTLFNKRLEDKFYISALTSLGSPGGETKEKVESICFKQNNVCNYEGSLWATLALNKKDSTVREKVLPYLLALSSDNSRLLPSAFLYALIPNVDEYFTELTNEQKKEGYWQTSTDSSKRYYDTAVALMALYGKSKGQADQAVSYLLTPNVQGDGCWGNSIKSTAFLLYAANPKPVSSSGGLTSRTMCKNVENHPEYSCTSSAICQNNLNGTILDNFYCVAAGDICCDKQYSEPSCSSKSGKICLSSQDCSTGFVSAKESYCCLGECQEASAPIESLCPSDYTCKAECSANEEEQTVYTCADNTGKCCSTTTTTKNYTWIWLLVILIILIALAIFYRNQLKVWWFKFKNKFSKNPVAQQTRPPQQPPYGMMRRPFGPPGMPMRPGMRPMPMQRPLTRLPPRPFPKEKELSETLKKLRDMSGNK